MNIKRSLAHKENRFYAKKYSYVLFLWSIHYFQIQHLYSICKENGAYVKGDKVFGANMVIVHEQLGHIWLPNLYVDRSEKGL